MAHQTFSLYNGFPSKVCTNLFDKDPDWDNLTEEEPQKHGVYIDMPCGFSQPGSKGSKIESISIWAETIAPKLLSASERQA
jgi:hypothetical protein